MKPTVFKDDFNTQSNGHEWDLSLELSAHKHVGSNLQADQYNDQPWVYVFLAIRKDL